MVLETVIKRSKVSNTLYDVVEIDEDGDIVNYVARNATFEQAQNILEEMFEPLTTVL
jgi:cell fate regulator YaaT (PSP1 superfamily)